MARRLTERAGALARVSAAAPVLVALVTSFFLIGHKSMWGDEAFSVQLARLDLSSFWEVVSNRQANMSLHSLLLRGWIELGDSEAAVRSLSALAAVAAAGVVTLLGTRLFDRTIGTVAGVLLAANAFSVHYAQEARGYSLALLLAAGSTYLFVRLVESGTTTVWVSYVLVSALGLYAHFFVAFVIAAHGVAIWAAPAGVRRRALAAIAAVVVAGAPLALFVATRDAGQVDLVPGASPYRIVAAFGALAGGTIPMLLLYALGGLVALVTLARGRHDLSAQARWRYALLLSWLVVPVAGSLLLNLVKPFFMARYLLVVLPPIVILVALGVRSLPSRAAVAAAAALLALGSVHALAGWYAGEEKEGLDFRAATDHIGDAAGPTDGIVFYRPSRRLPVEYYLRRRHALDAAPAPVFPASAWGEFDLIEDYESRRPESGSWTSFVESAASRHDRLWLVQSEGDLHEDERVALERALGAAFTQRDRRDFGELQVVLFQN